MCSKMIIFTATKMREKYYTPEDFYFYFSAILQEKRPLISKTPARLRSKVWNREAWLFGALDGEPLRAKRASGASARTGGWQCGSSLSTSALG